MQMEPVPRLQLMPSVAAAAVAVAAVDRPAAAVAVAAGGVCEHV